tara:strand:- start:189 stop:887 length:699 start_codon:yes stop_codon:yes gene_type:complete
MDIIPAIIPQDFQDLTDKMSMVHSLVPMVQIDVVDGTYTPSRSWPYQNGADIHFEEIKEEKKGMPFWQDLQFEVDLMIRYPERVWKDWIRAGATRLIIHLDSTDNIDEIIDGFKEEVVAEYSFVYAQLGVAVGSTTDRQKISDVAEKIDFIQCMGIEKIGFQGQLFDENIFDTIGYIRTHHPNTPITIDGGVNEDTITRLKDAGVERFAIGSALFESDNIEEEIEYLSSMIK